MLCTTFSLSLNAQIQLEELDSHKGVYTYRYDDSDYSRAFAFVAPTYFVYPDKSISLEEAQKLLDEMGFNRGALKDNANSFFVINPLGAQYDEQSDFERFKEIYNLAFLHINIKVIGIGAGADFVNKAIAPHSEGIAGIVSIGGKLSYDSDTAVVPAYICGNNASEIAKSYISSCNASLLQKG